MIATVVERLPNERFRLELENGRQVEGTIPAQSRALLVRVKVGEVLEVEVSPFDRGKVRILGPAGRGE